MQAGVYEINLFVFVYRTVLYTALVRCGRRALRALVFDGYLFVVIESAVVRVVQYSNERRKRRRRRIQLL